jgi:hypothetical protein
MTPLLRKLYEIRRAKRKKAEERIQERRDEESLAILQARAFRAARVKSKVDAIRFREEFGVVPGGGDALARVVRVVSGNNSRNRANSERGSRFARKR